MRLSWLSPRALLLLTILGLLLLLAGSGLCQVALADDRVVVGLYSAGTGQLGWKPDRLAEVFEIGIVRPPGLLDFGSEAVCCVEAPAHSRHGAAMFSPSTRAPDLVGDFVETGLPG